MVIQYERRGRYKDEYDSYDDRKPPQKRDSRRREDTPQIRSRSRREGTPKWHGA